MQGELEENADDHKDNVVVPKENLDSVSDHIGETVSKQESVSDHVVQSTGTSKTCELQVSSISIVHSSTMSYTESQIIMSYVICVCTS